MKTQLLISRVLISILACGMLLSTGRDSRAQVGTTNLFPPIVTIRATDPVASEPGVLAVIDPGIFTISRSRGTNVDMTVYYAIGGTATNGVDYVGADNLPLPMSVVIPKGSLSAQIVIRPLADNLPEGAETVVIKLLPVFCIAIYPPPEGCYQVGSPSEAAVCITDTDQTNLPPVVTVVAVDPVATEGTNCWRWPGYSPCLALPGCLSCWTTNSCRTNTAAFLVRRTGDLSDDLTVGYNIGGTASNGVDYVALPGMVTIPAGNRWAPVVVVPSDDALPERLETVVLKLVPSPLDVFPPPYIIGRPGKAAAIIVDNDQPRPPVCVLPDQSFHFQCAGTNGQWFRIECSTNLIHWTPICTNIVTDGAVHFVDPDAGNGPSLFYRAVRETNPPPLN